MLEGKLGGEYTNVTDNPILKRFVPHIPIPNDATITNNKFNEHNKVKERKLKKCEEAKNYEVNRFEEDDNRDFIAMAH
jgi:hypothetical protein